MDQLPGQFPPPSEMPPPDPPPATAPHAMHPLGLDRVLQLTFSLFRHRWRALIGVALVIMLPVMTALAVLQAAVGGELARAQQAQLDWAAGLPVSLDQLVPVGALAASYAAVLITGLAGYVAQAGLVALVGSTYAGGHLSGRAALTMAFGRLPTLLGIGLIVVASVFVLVFVGVVAGVLVIVGSSVDGRIQPGLGVFIGLIIVVAVMAAMVFLLVRWSFAVQVAALERTSARAALARSWRLVSGSSWRVLGYTLLMIVLIGLIAVALSVIVGLFVGSGFMLVDGRIQFDLAAYILATILEAIFSIVTMPLTVIALTLLYFDLRFRRGEPPIPVA